MRNNAEVPLKAAIKLHAAHMDGSAPTSRKSQMEMMTLMEEALGMLVGKEPNMLGMSDNAMKDM